LAALWLCVPVLAAQTPDSAACRGPAGYDARELRGTVLAGEVFQAVFGDRFALVLDPVESGWLVRVREAGRADDLAGLTPPWHFVPNPRSVEGWHFRNADNTGPNDGSVNAPGEEREFIFSPEVGRTLQYLGSATPQSTVDRVAGFGRGRLVLTEYELTPPARGERAAFRRMGFVACLVWRSG
jgi:hypothetical protein